MMTGASAPPAGDGEFAHSPGEASAALLEAMDALKRRQRDERERLVREAFAAGVNKRQIALRMGISRTTVYAILGAAAQGNGEGGRT